jgi:hypothetical protein
VNAVAQVDRQLVLREKGAEFTAARNRVMQAIKLPVVQASAFSRARMDTLALRAARLQTAIEQIGKMIDGARRWFQDTFSLDVATEIPIANTAIDTTMQTAIAGMNYFIRDANVELERVAGMQKLFDAANDDQKKTMLGELHAQSLPTPAAPSKANALILALIVGGLWWLNRKGDDDEETA